MDEALELHQILGRWLRWYRFQRAIVWSMRGVLLGLGFALILAVLFILQGRLVIEEFWRLVAIGTSAGLILAALTAATWPAPPLETARFFDQHFGLQERVSTAVELSNKPDAHPPDLEIHQKQLRDALKAARRVDVQRMLPIRVNGLEIGLIAVLLAAGFLMTRWAVPYFTTAQNLRSVQKAIAEQAAQAEALRQQVEQSETLTQEQRQALTAPLEEMLHKLEDANTLEQAASAINDAQQQLSALNTEQSQEQSQALQDTGEHLSAISDNSLQQFGKDLVTGDYQGAAQELKNLDPNSLDPAQREALANELSQAAANLQASNPQLAEQLQAAGDALQNTGEAAHLNQDVTSNLQQAAQTLQATGQNLAQAQAAAQASAQLSQGQQQMVAQAGQSITGSQSQAGSGSQSGANQQGGQNSAGGAGRDEQTDASETGDEVGTAPIQQNNSPGDGGESQYEQIYAPQRLGGPEGQDVQLPGSGQSGEQVIGQSQAAPESPGLSTVPYVEALPDYQDAYRQAIEGDQIPIHLRSLIRDYFSSLEP